MLSLNLPLLGISKVDDMKSTYNVILASQILVSRFMGNEQWNSDKKSFDQTFTKKEKKKETTRKAFVKLFVLHANAIISLKLGWLFYFIRNILQKALKI